jgi:protein O-GlcNAc transferase
MADAQATLARGLEHHQVGRLAQAEAAYRAVLTQAPRQPDALHLLAVLTLQQGKVAEGRRLAKRAVDAAPRQSGFWNTLGLAQQAAGRLGEAVAAFAQATALAPDNAEAWANLATVQAARGDQAAESTALTRLTTLLPGHAPAWSRRGVLAYLSGQLHEAAGHFQQVVRLAPDDADAWNNLGATQLQLGQAAEAEVSLRRAVTLRPDAPGAAGNLALALVSLSRWQEAADLLTDLVRREQDDARTWINYGHALKGLERYGESQDAYRHGLALQPDSTAAMLGIGDTLQKLDAPGEAIPWYEQALALDGQYVDAWEHLAIALGAAGQPARAEAAFRRVLELAPDRLDMHSALIFALDLREGAQDRANEERRRWNARAGELVRRARTASPRPHPRDRAPDRKLRVGYVSADFRAHSAGFLALPVLRAHDRGQVTVYCYSGVRQPDEMTERFRAAADVWHEAHRLTDDELDAQIRADEIDILVDLSGHTLGNRLAIFAREPAPLQVTAWGYATGTGLETMHYFLADDVVVPPGARHWYREEIVALPSLLCYEPPSGLPPLAPPPLLTRGQVSFGAFNRMEKVSAGVCDAWACLLTTVPHARLVVKTGRGEGPARQRLLDELVSRGIARDRIEVRDSTAHLEHLAAHNEIDILLDTFPHGGGVTSIEALLMGVPVVTVLGERVAGRLAASFLTSVGMTDLIAQSADEYVMLAARLAGDRDRLARERATLRGRVLASPMGNPELYTRHVEAAYRWMWRRWCEDLTPDPAPTSRRETDLPAPPLRFGVRDGVFAGGEG